MSEFTRARKSTPDERPPRLINEWTHGLPKGEHERLQDLRPRRLRGGRLPARPVTGRLGDQRGARRRKVGGRVPRREGVVRGARGGPFTRARRPPRIRRRRRACGGGVALGAAGDESRTAVLAGSSACLWYPRSVMRRHPVLYVDYSCAPSADSRSEQGKGVLVSTATSRAGGRADFFSRVSRVVRPPRGMAGDVRRTPRAG
mmetsp:Transcript_25951/g.87583  ORF Transcript_25951/g.87583 Transcript_25951/m.87583 type:complete len:202 (+) Transcript_25951:1636-2241(+)